MKIHSLLITSALLAWLSPVAPAQTDGRPGVDSTPSDLRPPAIRSGNAANPAVPETPVGDAKPVDLDPKFAQAEAVEDDKDIPAPDLSLFEIMAGSQHLTTLVGAIKAAGLEEVFRSEGPETVFAPTNTAFQALPPGVLENLLLPANRETLRNILRFHTVSGEKMMAADLKPGDLTTMQGTAVINPAIN